ncbi:MAG TPA: glycosyltransferase family 2 protein [Dissulfurispiraceae bacterium]|nr:glycosyltransferase family 2 protein [Dissulfurispiraceae bacterium]
MLIIIPAHNEAKTVAGVVRQCLEYGDVLVIDDGSQDDTTKEALAAGAYVIMHQKNKGYGEALQTGYRYALDHRKDEIIVQLDADGQHNPKYIPALARALEGADMVLGSRFIDGPGYKIPFCRRVGMMLFSFIASWMCGTRMTDTTSGYRAINRKALAFCASKEYPRDYPDANALVMMHRAGLRLREIPVKMRASLKGTSMHSGAKPVYYVFKVLFDLGRG